MLSTVELVGTPTYDLNPGHGYSPNLWVPVDGGTTSPDYGGFDPNETFDFVDQSGGFEGLQNDFAASINEIEISVVGYKQVISDNVNTEILVMRDSDNQMEWMLTTAHDTVTASDSGMITTQSSDGTAGPSVVWQIDKGVFDAWTVYPDGTATHVMHETAFNNHPLPPLGGN